MTEITTGMGRRCYSGRGSWSEENDETRGSDDSTHRSGRCSPAALTR